MEIEETRIMVMGVKVAHKLIQEISMVILWAMEAVHLYKIMDTDRVNKLQAMDPNPAHLEMFVLSTINKTLQHMVVVMAGKTGCNTIRNTPELPILILPDLPIPT
jgi:hypothetical protein